MRVVGETEAMKGEFEELKSRDEDRKLEMERSKWRGSCDWSKQLCEAQRSKDTVTSMGTIWSASRHLHLRISQAVRPRVVVVHRLRACV